MENSNEPPAAAPDPGEVVALVRQQNDILEIVAPAVLDLQKRVGVLEHDLGALDQRVAGRLNELLRILKALGYKPGAPLTGPN